MYWGQIKTRPSIYNIITLTGLKRAFLVLTNGGHPLTGESSLPLTLAAAYNQGGEYSKIISLVPSVIDLLEKTWRKSESFGYL
jgi:hypothetical protein